MCLALKLPKVYKIENLINSNYLLIHGKVIFENLMKYKNVPEIKLVELGIVNGHDEFYD